MRLAVLLGCLYVLLLTVRPCCADNDCANEPPAKTEQANKPAKAPKPCTACSPFFSCGQCAGFVVAKPFVPILVMYSETLVQPYPAYLAPHVQETSQTIWQPPQLC